MAVKKTTKKADESAAPAKTEAKETAPKTKAPKTKAAAPKAAEPAEAKAAPKEAAPAASAAPKASTPKKAAAPVKLTPPQGELLKKIGSAAEPGYTAEKSAEERSIKLLMDKKLVRKGAKDKATGKVPYALTVAGKKHLG